MSDPRDYVEVITVRGDITLTQTGFETACVPSYTATWTERYRLYSGDSEVETDFPNSRSPERRMSAAYFGQNPAPANLMIGRMANKPTQRYSIGLGTVRSSYAYHLTFRGDSIAESLLTFTTDSSGTDAELAAGLVAAINGISGKNFTAAATGGVMPVVVTADAAGTWFSVELSDAHRRAGDLTIVQTHADPGTAADLSEIENENPDFYLFYGTHVSLAVGQAIYGWIATRKKIAIAENDHTLAATAALAGGGNDLMDVAKTNNVARTAVAYHRDMSKMHGLAWASTRLVLRAGSENWKGASPKLVPAMNLTTTERGRITAKNGNSNETQFGSPRSFDGRFPDGEWIDVIRGLDALDSQIQANLFVVQTKAAKVPLTAGGLNTLKGAVEAALAWAQDPEAQILDTVDEDGNPPEVTIPRISELTDQQIADREVPIDWKGRLAGAVNKSKVRGTVQS